MAAEEGITYTLQFLGTKQGKGKAELLKEVVGSEGEYNLQNDDLYVRAKVISSKLQDNPFAKGDTETAWTQPVMP